MSTEREWPRYKCHKVVRALKIARIDIEPINDAMSKYTLVPEDPAYAPFEVPFKFVAKHLNGNRTNKPGYYVVYADGYQSWSPVKAFEEGYTRL